MPEKAPIIIVPYSNGRQIFKIVDDLTITDILDVHIADHPNIKFRYMWNLNRVTNKLRNLETELEKFKSTVCSYWARYILCSEGYDVKKITNANIDMIINRAWSEVVVSDEDEINEYIDMAVNEKYSTVSEREKHRDKIAQEMYPTILDKNNNKIWFLGLEVHEEEINKWRVIKDKLVVAVESLKDKGFALGYLKDLKIDGILDLARQRNKLKQDYGDQNDRIDYSDIPF